MGGCHRRGSCRGEIGEGIKSYKPHMCTHIEKDCRDCPLHDLGPFLLMPVCPGNFYTTPV